MKHTFLTPVCFIRVEQDEGALRLHPIKDMGIQDASFGKLWKRETQLQARLESLPFHKDEKREDQLQR